MNTYVVVEGEGELKLYRKWIPFINPNLQLVQNIDSIQKNNFYIICGYGFPNMLSIIKSAILDVLDLRRKNNNQSFVRLVISLDSEDKTYEEKKEEIIKFINTIEPNFLNQECKIIIQHFCLETWGLGNKIIFSRKPKNYRLREYISHYNVLLNDPENLIIPQNYEGNRAQFAKEYLRLLIREKFRQPYRESNPLTLMHEKFFNQIKDRFNTTLHINSFRDFLDAFSYNTNKIA